MKLDKDEHRKYLMELCKEFGGITQPASKPGPTVTISSFWDKAKHIVELVYDHAKFYHKHEQHTKESKSHSYETELFINPQQLRAMCKEGNRRWCMSMSCPESVSSSSRRRNVGFHFFLILRVGVIVTKNVKPHKRD